ncbi:MAG: hypothetical protein RLZZ399_670 [Verrucomicrobiota bacterium]|jgi:uncharacterized coiled-coil protein SlyX
MNDPERLTRLEEYYAHLQLHVSEQDKVILELRDDVIRLKRELSRQRELLQSSSSTSVPDERPPHYSEQAMA